MIGNILIYTFFLALSLGQLSRLSFLNAQFNIYLSDIVLFLLLLYLGVRYMFEPFQYYATQLRVTFWLLTFLPLTFLISVTHFSVVENVVSFSYYLRYLLYLLIFLYSSHWIKKEKNILLIFKSALYLFAGIVTATSLVQYFLYPDLRNIEYLGWDPHLHRMVGTFLDTSVAAAVYGVMAVFFLGRKQFVFFTLFLVLLLFSYSRSAYVGMMICVGVYVFHQRERQSWLYKPLSITAIFVAVASIFTVMIMLIPKPFGEGGNLLRTATVVSRFTDFKEAMILWQNNPIVGVGFNRLRYAKERAHFKEQGKIEVSHSGASLHSSYLMLLVTGGIIGLVLYVYSLKEIFLRSKLGLYIFIFAGFMSLADNILLHAFILPLVLFLAAADQLSFS